VTDASGVWHHGSMLSFTHRIRLALAVPAVLASCGGDTVLVTPPAKAGPDTGVDEASEPPGDTGGLGDTDPPCPDADADGVCDDEDDCPGEDDTLDADGDGVPDCLDPCPDDPDDDIDGDGICGDEDPCPDDPLDDRDGDGVCDSVDPCPDDAPDDTDGDTVCDSDDVCPDGDDLLDANGDGVPDACGQCKASGGWTVPDADGDGLPEDCVLRVLLVDGHDELSDNAEVQLLARGWEVDRVLPSTAATSVVLGDYDVAVIAYEYAMQAQTRAVNANEAGEVGLVIQRGPSDSAYLGMSGTMHWQAGDCTVEDDSHFITATLGVGPVDVGYTYKSILEAPTADARTLVGCPDPSTAVHRTHRRVVTTYYAHDAGMPWAPAGALLDTRSYAWAAGFGAL